MLVCVFRSECDYQVQTSFLEKTPSVRRRTEEEKHREEARREERRSWQCGQPLRIDDESQANSIRDNILDRYALRECHVA